MAPQGLNMGMLLAYHREQPEPVVEEVKPAPKVEAPVQAEVVTEVEPVEEEVVVDKKKPGRPRKED